MRDLFGYHLGICSASAPLGLWCNVVWFWFWWFILPSFRTMCQHESWSSERKAFRSVLTQESLSPIEVHGVFGNADLPSTSWENPRAIAVFNKVWESLGQTWSFVSFCVRACVLVCVLACARVKRQITGVNSLLQLHGFWVLNSDPQAWQNIPLPGELFHQSRTASFSFTMNMSQILSSSFCRQGRWGWEQKFFSQGYVYLLTKMWLMSACSVPCSVLSSEDTGKVIHDLSPARAPRWGDVMMPSLLLHSARLTPITHA